MVGSPAVGSPRAGASLSAAALNLLGASAVVGGLAAWLILAGHRVPAGLAGVVAVLLLQGGHAAAARSGRPSEGFADRVVDRVLDACLLAPIAWVLRHGPSRPAVLALVALGATFLAAYVRARGWSLGYRIAETAPYRLLRGLVIAIGLLTGWVEAAMWIVAVLSLAAAAVRTLDVIRQERANPRRFPA
jgi:phosphatidylglycerophosphate synthase